MENIPIIIHNHRNTGNNPTLETESCCDANFVISDDKLVPCTGHNDQRLDCVRV